MLKAAAVFLVLGFGSSVIGFSSGAVSSSAAAYVLGFVCLTLFLIFLILGLPSTRNLVS